jgi:predicted transcriptional regulator
MKLVTIREKVVSYRTRRMSRSKAASYFLKKYYKTGKMSQSDIARKLKVSVQCVNEVADKQGLVVRR